MKIVAVANNSQLRLMSPTETTIINTDASPEIIIKLAALVNCTESLQRLVAMILKERLMPDDIAYLVEAERCLKAAGLI